MSKLTKEQLIEQIRSYNDFIKYLGYDIIRVRYKLTKYSLEGIIAKAKSNRAMCEVLMHAKDIKEN
ncbi:MAG: hypothetical protein ACXAC2_05625 [Candidatus Kariarchaeaceae archaeon]